MAKHRKKNQTIHIYPTRYGTFSFTRPSLFNGTARLLDFTGALRTRRNPISDDEADTQAIESDWSAVGDDFCRALSSYEERFQRRQLGASRELVGSK